MSLTGIEAFDRSFHETNAWLKVLKTKLGIEDSRIAYRALRAGLHVLRGRIGPENAVHLGAQLPMLLPGLYPASTSKAGTWQRRQRGSDIRRSS